MLRLFSSRLSARLTVLLLLGGLVPVLGVGALAIRSAEVRAYAEAERRERRLAERAAALVESAVLRAEEKLVTLARLLARELTERQVGSYALSNDAYRDTVLERIEGLVEPADVFLALQYFASGPTLQFVGQAVQSVLGPRPSAAESTDVVPSLSLSAPHFQIDDLEIRNNAQNDLVLVPARAARPVRETRLSSTAGYTFLRTSVPVALSGGSTDQVLGVLVAYVDFSRLRKTLEAVLGDGEQLVVQDSEGTRLVALGGSADASESLGVEAAIDSLGWTVAVREPRDRVEAPLRLLRRRWLGWIVGAVVLAIGLGLFFSLRMTRPIEALRRAAEEMERGDLSVRTGISRADEIGRLAAAFDSMAAAVGRLDAAKSAFAGNVSHELRTPLAAMRVSVANLLDGVVGPLTEGQRSPLERLRADLDRLITTTDDLLYLTRLEAGVVEPTRIRVDLAALAQEAIAGVHRAAEARGQTLSVDGRGTASGDPVLLRRVLTNLLDNAIKFGPSESRVRVVVSPGELRVCDEGPGFDGDDLFEKFHQGHQAGVKSPGVGLGLAIVRQLVELQGGTVFAEAGGGSQLVVRLPREDEP